jgi:serine protease
VATAVERARQEGVMLVASMGNNGLPMRIYPAAYPWVIAVGATDRDDRRAAFSTWGCWMDVSAPGKDIFGLWPAFSSGYANMSGTSASAPQVSGLLAWVWSRHPEWRAENWQDWLGQAAKDLGERGYDPRFGKGRVQYDWVSGKLERGECGTQIEL